MSKKSPFISCLNPIHIQNPYTKEPLLVGCGKCEACTQKKSAMLSLKCKLESLVHKYCYFITLTYNNENIPLLRFIEHDGHVHFATEDGECLSRLDYSFGEMSKLLQKCGRLDALHYLRKYDLQLFFKRLRKNLSKITNEKVRYFAAGEYGPVHFRPHYHILLWFDSDVTAENLGQMLHKSWPFGRVDFSKSRGQCSNYVAGYVNSACRLPEVFKQSQTRPFNCHSIKLGEAFLSASKEEVYSMRPVDFVQRRFNFGNGDTEFVIWRSFTAAFYPKCKSFTEKSHEERYYSYAIYDIASSWARETRPWRIAKFLGKHIIEVGWKHFVPEYERLLGYFRKSMRIPKYKILTLDDYDTITTAIYNEVRISEHFINFVCNGSSSIWYRDNNIRMIDNFYKEIELHQLNTWYSNMQDYFNEHPEVEDIQFLYCNTFDEKQYKNSSAYKIGKECTLKNYDLHTKHKELNDLNKIFEY